MKTIAHVILTIICFALSVSCSNQKTKTVTKSVDSTLYITKDIKLYANIDTLLEKDVLSPSVANSSNYTSTNKCIYGINFQEVSINFEHDKSDTLYNIACATMTSIDSVQSLYGHIYKELRKKYSKPQREHKQYNDEHNVTASDAVWYKNKIVIILSSGVQYENQMGAVGLIFTTPKDTVYYKNFMF